MKRRKFVAASGAALLAGCNEAQDADPDPDDPDPENVTSEPEPSENGPVGDVVIQDFEWTIEGEVSQFLLSNVGEGLAGQVSLVVQWFDSDGYYIGHDQASLPLLPPQNTWFIEIEPSAPFEADRFEGYVEFDSQYEVDSDPIESIDIDQSSPGVTGILPLDRDSETVVQITALTFSSGWVTHAGEIAESRVPENTDLRFFIPLTQAGSDEPSVGNEVEVYYSILE